MGIGKAADDQIGLAHAAAPGAEQELLAPLIQALARSFRHGGSEKTPKARTRPGEGYIENDGPNVSIRHSGAERSEEPGIHNPGDCGYGFRARRYAAPRNDARMRS